MYDYAEPKKLKAKKKEKHCRRTICSERLGNIQIFPNKDTPPLFLLSKQRLKVEKYLSFYPYLISSGIKIFSRHNKNM